MKLINYNPKTGEVKITTKETIDTDEIGLLRKIKEDKKISFKTLVDLREKEIDADGQYLVDLLQIIHSLESFGLVKEGAVYDKQVIVDTAFRITNTGTALLKIIDKQKEIL